MSARSAQERVLSVAQARPWMTYGPAKIAAAADLLIDIEATFAAHGVGPEVLARFAHLNLAATCLDVVEIRQSARGAGGDES